MKNILPIFKTIKLYKTNIKLNKNSEKQAQYYWQRLNFYIEINNKYK